MEFKNFIVSDGKLVPEEEAPAGEVRYAERETIRQELSIAEEVAQIVEESEVATWPAIQWTQEQVSKLSDRLASI